MLKQQQLGNVRDKPGSEGLLAKLFPVRQKKSLGQLIEELANDVRWNLTSKKYNRDELAKIFESFQGKTMESLTFMWLHWNSQVAMPKMVIQLSLPKLRILNIGGNKIVSVECLQHARMESLQELWLWNNHITRVDCLRKMKVPKLKYIDLSSNAVVEWGRFHEMYSRCFDLVNLQGNGIADVNGFAKSVAVERSCMINILDTKVVRVEGKSCQKKKKRAKLYYLGSGKVTYV